MKAILIKNWVWLVAGGVWCVWAVVLLSHPFGVSPEQVKLWGSWGLVEEWMIRVAGLVLLAVNIVVWGKNIKSDLGVVFISTNLWLYSLSIWHGEFLIYLFVLGWVWEGRTKLKKVIGLVLTLLLVWGNWGRSQWIKDVGKTKVGEEAFARQKSIYLANEKVSSWPVVGARIVNNKPFILSQNVFHKLASTIDPTLWSSAMPAWVITQYSKIPTKNLWETIYFWEPFLVIAGLTVFSFSGWLWLLVGIIPLTVFDAKDWVWAGVFFWPMWMKWVVLGMQKIAHINFLKFALFLLMVVSFGLWTNDKFRHIGDWVDSRQLAYRYIARVSEKYSEFPKAWRITNRFGPVETMWRYYVTTSNQQVVFGEFTPEEMTSKSGIWVGLDGEFLGSAKSWDENRKPPGGVIEYYDLPDEMVAEYGRRIWVVEN